MEPWTAQDDRPYLRPADASSTWWMVVLVLIVAAAAVAYWYVQKVQETASAVTAPPAPERAAATPQAAPDPAVRYPLAGAPGEPATQPTLENSDSMMRDVLTGLLGRKSFDELVYPAQLVRRIVATVDNLPRETAPRRVMPLQPVPGAFFAAHAGEETTIGADNAARYAPYVRVLESLDSRALVRRYIESYGLFQRAYEELGYPNRYFNDRLVEAIDDMLAAPEIAEPVRLVRPKVLYQFADPDLERRSAGQKVMIRMGAANAARVKAKLREIRAEIAAAARR